MDEKPIESQEETPTGSNSGHGSSPKRSLDDRAEEAIGKGKDLGRQAMEQTKEAVENARSAVMLLITDPMGGQKQAWENLGAKNAMSAGIVLLVGSTVGLWVGGRMLLGGMVLGVGFIQQLVMSSLVAVAYAISMWGVGKAFGGKADIPGSVFSAGVGLAPAAIGALAGSVMSLMTLYSLGHACLVFGFAVSVLLVNAAMLDLHGLTTRRAVLATPVMLVVSLALVRAMAAILV